MKQAVAALALGLAMAQVGAAQTRFTALEFEDLQGFDEDDLATALNVFKTTCPFIKSSDAVPSDAWDGVCEAAEASTDPATFFKSNFLPVLIEADQVPLITGYYEPVLYGSLEKIGDYIYPIHKLPPDAPDAEPWFSRAEIDQGALDGKGHELVWLKDPVEAFFLHVQGSGRIALVQGGSMRVGFAGRNNHDYRSVGKELIRKGALKPHEASATRIKAWVRSKGEEGTSVLHHNPSYVFFTEVTGLSETSGPNAAMGLPVTERRSIAVDPIYQPLGAPVWLEFKSGTTEMSQLMIAQDVGSAVNGAQRADVFFGTGDVAGAVAGTIKSEGRLVTLLPKDIARSLTGSSE